MLCGDLNGEEIQKRGDIKRVVKNLPRTQLKMAKKCFKNLNEKFRAMEDRLQIPNLSVKCFKKRKQKEVYKSNI